MSQPRSQLSDHELGDLLVEAFTAHEHLADPDVAVRIAAAPGRSRRTGRVLLGAAAAVVLVAGGTTYGLTRGTGGSATTTGPDTHQPPLPPLQSNAVNRAKATAAGVAALARMPTYSGAQPSGPIPGLTDGASTATTPDYTVTRFRWWKVDSTQPQAIARWYALHPPQGFTSEDGSFVSSTSDGTTTVYIADLSQPGRSSLPPAGVTIEVQTTALPGGTTGIRASALSFWSPARPRASYVQDATSIDVYVTHTTYSKGGHTTHSSFTVRNPREILKAEIVFDGLDGTGPLTVSCPAMMDMYRDRVVFHTPTGDVTVTTGGSCVDIATVQRDGRTIGPGLAYGSWLMESLGLTR